MKHGSRKCCRENLVLKNYSHHRLVLNFKSPHYQRRRLSYANQVIDDDSITIEKSAIINLGGPDKNYQLVMFGRRKKSDYSLPSDGDLRLFDCIIRLFSFNGKSFVGGIQLSEFGRMWYQIL